MITYVVTKTYSDTGDIDRKGWFTTSTELLGDYITILLEAEGCQVFEQDTKADEAQA